jgi:hypothetical protein
MLRHDHPMHAEGFGGPQQRPQVARILDLIQRDEEGRLPPLLRDRQQRLEIHVGHRRDPGHHALVPGGAGDGVQLVAGPEGHLHPRAPGQRDDLGQGPGGPGQHGDFVGPPATGPKQGQDRVATEHDLGRRARLP